MALTPDDAMARAAAVLGKAEEAADFDRDSAEALVMVADGWRRIAQTIHHQDLAEQTPRPPARTARAPRPTPQPLAQPPAPRPQPPRGR